MIGQKLYKHMDNKVNILQHDNYLLYDTHTTVQFVGFLEHHSLPIWKSKSPQDLYFSEDLTHSRVRMFY